MLCNSFFRDWLLCRDENDELLFKVDQSKELRLRVTVQNLGEDAHEASVYIHLPPDVGYIDVDKVGDWLVVSILVMR